MTARDDLLARIELGKPFADISRRVTASYPAGMDPELVMRRRVGKVGVEYGELLDAIEGWTGENPRKGVYATKEEVIKELIDCASASLCAVEYLTGDLGRSVSILIDQVRGNQERLLTALAADTTPEPTFERLLSDPNTIVWLKDHGTPEVRRTFRELEASIEAYRNAPSNTISVPPLAIPEQEAGNDE